METTYNKSKIMRNTSMDDIKGTESANKENDVLDRWFDNLSDASWDNQSGFDKRIAYIGAGAIVISVVIAANIDLRDSIILFVGICLIILSIGIHLSSFLLANAVMYHYQSRLNQNSDDLSMVDEQGNGLYRWTMWLNIISALPLIIGNCLIAYSVCFK